MDPFARVVVPILIQDEMRNSYLDYSMSVIIGRALPDVRDGLKPVHRRILYAMHEMGMRHDKKYTKCAGVVGEVLKKFHPHGDSSVYDALVRMAQPWNLRALLIDGQGNFGSVDGDPPAAYRYTESRMTALASELLIDIEKSTVDFSPNFDDSTVEPDVLPCRFPNLLVNGADGIAVGMATKIPPHNLGEIVDGVIAVIDDPYIDVDDLMRIIPGPDFPTHGTIYGRAGVREAYATGRGRVVVRGRAEFEEMEHGRTAIIIDEIPFQVNKARLVESIADLVREKRVEGISALRDESDRSGMRIVVELKKDAFPEVVLNHLYKHTALQSTFGVIMLAIVNQRPRVLTLKEMIQHFISHRREVILRRTRHELAKARDRAHILEGFLKALAILDAVIAAIRASSTVGDARDALTGPQFEFTVAQADAILDLRLQRLTGMELFKIQEEFDNLMSFIRDLEEILGSETRLMNVVKTELIEVRNQYADVRRTRIVDADVELSLHDLVAQEDQIVTFSRLGYVKRCKQDAWRMQKRGGFGKKGMATREEDFVTKIFVANTHATLLVFTDKGLVFPLPVYELPETSRDAKGRPIINLVPEIPDGQRITALITIKELDSDDKELLFVTRQGLVKRTTLSAFKNLRQGGMRATSCEDGDELLGVHTIDDPSAHVILFSREGKCIRFPLKDVPQYGRTARGNYGMKLMEGDVIVNATLAPNDGTITVAEETEVEDEPTTPEVEVEGEEAAIAADSGEVDPTATLLLTVTENAYGARVPFGAYRTQGRYGKGILSFKVTEKTGAVVGAVEVHADDQIMLVTDSGRVIRIRAADVRPTKSRSVQGVRLMRLEEGERLVDLARIEDPEDAASDGTVADEPQSDEPSAE